MGTRKRSVRKRSCSGPSVVRQRGAPSVSSEQDSSGGHQKPGHERLENLKRSPGRRELGLLSVDI